MKICSKCKIEKEEKFFQKKSLNKDGLNNSCKACNPNVEKYHDRKRNPENKGKVFRTKAYCNLMRTKFLFRTGSATQDDVDKAYIKYKKERQKRNNASAKYRYKTDPRYRAIRNCRSRTLDFLKSREKYSKTLGCSKEEFVKYLENQFTEGMSWDNYGQWHIDHIVPLSVAYDRGPEEFEKACHYTNLQPLWAEDHKKKTAQDFKIIKRSYRSNI